jgi:hypothetical protein
MAKSNKVTRHGHKGNAKKWQVRYRNNAAERAEMKEFGCINVDAWTCSPKLRLTQAIRMVDRLDRMGCEWRLIDLELEASTTKQVIK